MNDPRVPIEMELNDLARAITRLIEIGKRSPELLRGYRVDLNIERDRIGALLFDLKTSSEKRVPLWELQHG